MENLLAAPCSSCGRANKAGALVCALCGQLLRRERGEANSPLEPARPTTIARTIELRPTSEPESELSKEQPSVVNGRAHRRSDPSFAPVSRSSSSFDSLRAIIPDRGDMLASRQAATTTKPTPSVQPRSSPTRRAPATRTNALEPWIYLAIGLATAPIFAWTPILQYMGWFLASLVHEMGHATLAWVCGMPAMPAISLAGEAAAVHSDQMLVLVGAIAILVVSTSWRVLEGRARIVAVSAFCVLYPALAFTSAKELFHLLAGHGGELAFATLCLWKTLDGGFTESRVERGLYGTVGWYLLGKNVVLCCGLIFRADARAEYASSGSFGLTNDMIRAAEDVLHWRLESVASLMLVACALVLPAAIALWRATVAMRANALER